MECCTSKSVLQWFEAVAREDHKYLRENPDQLGAEDPREGDPSCNVFKGFAAIHYAVVLDKSEIFDFLLPHEWNIRTDRHIRLSTPLLPGDAKIQLASGEDCLSLAIAMGNEDCFKKILSQTFLSKLLNQIDGDGNSHLMLTAYFPYSKSIAEVLKSKQIVEELACDASKTFLYICCSLGRIQHINTVFNQLSDKLPFFRQFFKLYQGLTVFEALRTEEDMHKCGFTQEDKDHCREFLFSNVEDAYKATITAGDNHKEFLAIVQEDVRKMLEEVTAPPDIKVDEIGVATENEVHELDTETEKPANSDPGEDNDANPEDTAEMEFHEDGENVLAEEVPEQEEQFENSSNGEEE